MSLVTLSMAFSILTLVLVAVLACYLRRRAAGTRQTTREDVGDAPPPGRKEEG